MSGIVKIAAIVIALWAATEFFTEGVDGAFGGLLATAKTTPIEHMASAPQRAKVAAERALKEAEERRNRMLGE